jgi:hypothetical protein
MGANIDDAHETYKQEWANEMEQVFGPGKPNWDELIDPRTEDARRRSALLRDKYKMDPRLMKADDETYGPMEWRLPEAHAIYWAAQGLEMAKRNERKINEDDLITLRRVIYQSMQLSFQRGRLIRFMANKQRRVEYGPNLAIIPKVSAAYEQAMVDDPKNRDHIETAHRNFLRDAAFFLYTYNQQKEAIKWYKYLAEKYPDKALLENNPTSYPRTLSLEEYAIERVQGEVKDLGPDKTKAVLEGLEATALMNLALDEEDRFTGYDRLAQRIWERYQVKIGARDENKVRLSLPTMAEIRRNVLPAVLEELPDELAAQLKSKLPASMLAPATNAPDGPPGTPVNTSTNTPAAGQIRQ